MAELISGILTIIVCYLLGHWDEIKFNNRTSPDGYHTDRSWGTQQRSCS